MIFYTDEKKDFYLTQLYKILIGNKINLLKFIFLLNDEFIN